MRISVLTIAIIFITSTAFAQVDSVGLKDAMTKLDKALLDKDQATLQLLLHKELSYGHSNGIIQHKKDVLDDLKSGKMIYKKIAQTKINIVAVDDKKATVRQDTSAEGTMDEKPFQLNLYVMQVWLKTKKGWQLYARQSGKQ